MSVEGERVGGKEGGREGRREGGREGAREGAREEGRERGRERGGRNAHTHIRCAHTHISPSGTRWAQDASWGIKASEGVAMDQASKTRRQGNTAARAPA